jgi:putative N6-adenine-specific DNA methylase
MRFLVTASKGLEEVVSAELAGLGLPVLESSPGLLAFKGKREDAWRACLWLRAGRRVLQPVGTFSAPDAKALHQGALEFPWEDLVGPDRTFAVEASVRDSAFNHSGFVALKVKDAIADRVRAEVGRRPDVDRSNPDVSVVVHVARGRADVSLDLSGPLHKRGYRARSVAAPLKETLAAGILLMVGYDGASPLVDPFCGSGTLCIEGALIATRTAPGLLRQPPFGFQRWPGFDEARWKQILTDAESQRRRAPFPIRGSDVDPSAIRAADENAEWACVERVAKFRRADARTFSPPQGPPGLIATNPPYGDHVGEGEDLAGLYRAFGDALKQRCPGWRAALLTGSPALAKTIGLRPKRRIPLFNGPMECRLLEFEMYEGTRKGWSQGVRESGSQ